MQTEGDERFAREAPLIVPAFWWPEPGAWSRTLREMGRLRRDLISSSRY